MAETRRLYGVMNRRLADHAFFAGEEMSIADFAIVGCIISASPVSLPLGREASIASYAVEFPYMDASRIASRICVIL